jgi:hypothetical protein
MELLKNLLILLDYSDGLIWTYRRVESVTVLNILKNFH